MNCIGRALGCIPHYHDWCLLAAYVRIYKKYDEQTGEEAYTFGPVFIPAPGELLPNQDLWQAVQDPGDTGFILGPLPKGVGPISELGKGLYSPVKRFGHAHVFPGV